MAHTSANMLCEDIRQLYELFNINGTRNISLNDFKNIYHPFLTMLTTTVMIIIIILVIIAVIKS